MKLPVTVSRVVDGEVPDQPRGGDLESGGPDRSLLEILHRHHGRLREDGMGVVGTAGFRLSGCPDPRERGRQATAFLGRRHFDDADLLDALFEQVGQ